MFEEFTAMPPTNSPLKEQFPCVLLNKSSLTVSLSLLKKMEIICVNQYGSSPYPTDSVLLLTIMTHATSIWY